MSTLYYILREISMKKKIFSIIFTFIVIASVCLPAFKTSAYEISQFNISANAAMLVSMDTGEVLYEKNRYEKVYPASITKIMTAIVMLESDKYNPDAKITMTKEILDLTLGTGSAISHLKDGEIITHFDLLHLLLVSSSGDCALLVADFFGNGIQNFVTMMNEKAKQLGMENTVFLNPTGLHEDGHYTTAQDIYTMTSYALQNKTIKDACGISRYKLPPTNLSPERTFSTTNFLQDTTTNYYYRYASGVKTGFTDEAGRCVVSTASYNGYNYMCIVMGCKNDPTRRHEFAESAEFYRWAFNNFSFKEIANSESPVCEIPVNLSLDTDFVPLYVEKSFVSILPNDADTSTIVLDYHFESESVDAPIKKGDVIGTADVIFAENVLGTVNLVAGNDVASSPLLVAVEFFKNIITSIYVKIIFAVIVALIIIYIIICIVMNMGRKNKRRVKYIPYDERKEK